ncbi:MAG: discoidin domain-containing protein [Candidatus Pristimantibacillus lignocellulolyticus]|uniref:Discoidin domain-containing protein n=1 Tax=Candidatus Pristimantibacillus lignocellulolyticus TaxID=2994561 RepID=A0A9J6ZFV8_9BACL|nr:MAG: discoidin domain-containing protein [Candidatus Pristimantibacillus lignocellulolyticus]
MKIKWLWLSIGLVIIVALSYIIIFSGWLGNSGKVQMLINKEEGLIVVNNNHYEIAFSTDNGGIMYMKQQGLEENLSLGNQTLWWAILNDDSSIQSLNAENFTYDWKKGESELKLQYSGTLAVDVNVRFGDDDRIYMTASIENGTAETIKSFRFPYELKIDQNGVQDAILPMLPGAKLKGTFFQESNSYSDQYPGVMFASYLAMRTNMGNLSMYDLGDQTTLLTEIGYKHLINDPGKTSFVHNYKTWIESDQKWSSPTIVLEVGSDYNTSIVSYRELNEIDQYRSLKDKLGDETDKYFALPLYKTDISAIKEASWNNLSSTFIDKMNYNGMIHLVGFQKGGHDENYPNFMPPDSQWGGDVAFQKFVKDSKDKGNIVVPYTNMSWWGINSPTLNQLPTGTSLANIIVQKENGTIMQEDYGAHSGFVVNTGHPFFQQRVAEEHRKLIEFGGFDGIFEDQWGIRNSPYVFNEAIPEGTDPSTAYFTGVRNYFKTLKHNVYIEDGTDVLADNSVGFMGSTYLWDILGYRKNTASYTEYYPLAGMLLRDKVMFYHHNLAGETMTDDQDMLRWNLAMGYNLSTDFYNGVTSPWVDAIGVIQKYVLAPYVDQRVTNFEQVTSTVTITDFGKHKVTSNWDINEIYQLDNNITLNFGGYDVAAQDGRVRAGNYARYNGFDLDPGDHNLVEIRETDTIRIYQPIGSDTTLQIKKGDKWEHTNVVAYHADGTKIADLKVTESDNDVIFDYISLIKGQKVGYVELTNAKQPSQAVESFPKVKVEVNIAIGMKTNASSFTNDAFDPKFAVDGDPFTYWESVAKKFPQWLNVNLGEAKTVSKIKLRLPPQDAWEQRIQEIEVQGSSDGTTFSTLVPPKSYTYDPKSGNSVEIVLDEAVMIKYIRITITSNSAWPAAQVSELEIY